MHPQPDVARIIIINQSWFIKMNFKVNFKVIKNDQLHFTTAIRTF
jgi:hypothetical protein